MITMYTYAMYTLLSNTYTGSQLKTVHASKYCARHYLVQNTR